MCQTVVKRGKIFFRINSSLRWEVLSPQNGLKIQRAKKNETSLCDSFHKNDVIRKKSLLDYINSCSYMFLDFYFSHLSQLIVATIDY